MRTINFFLKSYHLTFTSQRKYITSPTILEFLEYSKPSYPQLSRLGEKLELPLMRKRRAHRGKSQPSQARNLGINTPLEHHGVDGKM